MVVLVVPLPVPMLVMNPGFLLLLCSPKKKVFYQTITVFLIPLLALGVNISEYHFSLLSIILFDVNVNLVMNKHEAKTGPVDHPKTESLTTRQIIKYTFIGCDIKTYILDTY
jgi:hypothetical protein